MNGKGRVGWAVPHDPDALLDTEIRQDGIFLIDGMSPFLLHAYPKRRYPPTFQLISSAL